MQKPNLNGHPSCAWEAILVMGVGWVGAGLVAVDGAAPSRPGGPTSSGALIYHSHW